MKINKILFFLPLFMISLAHTEPQSISNITFDGGYNLSKLDTEIADNESKDMCNGIVDSDGGLTKRNASRRFIEQALSTYSVNSLYRYYATSGTLVNKTLLSVIGNKIVHSTGGINPFWTTLTSSVISGDHWTWQTFQNKAIGVAPNNRIKQFDFNNSSFTDLLSVDITTNPIEIKSNYSLLSKNYFILGNVIVSTYISPLLSDTTYYPSRIYYSLLLQPSSFTWNRYIEYRTDNGEQIAGLGNKFDRVNIFKPSSIGEVSFTVLNLPSQGGDWQLNEVATDFGLEAPFSLAERGDYYIMGSRDGIRLWDGGRRQRATSGEELTLISRQIQPLIEKLIKANTYKKIIGKYYPKRDWYVMSYIDPDKFPKDRNNSVIIYDFKIAKWFPFCNWLVNSMEVFSGSNDKGELFLGDSLDSYVYQADIFTNDARKELIIDPMESTASWKGSSQDIVNLVEGTASLKISVDPTTTESSMTLVRIMPLGEWNDKTRIIKNDSLSFKIFIDSIVNISSLRIDLEVKDIDNAFDTNFTSVSLSSSTFNQEKNWQTINIALSSFPIRPDWTDLNIENQPFANTLTYYGLRFVLNGVDASTVSIDDVRIVQATENPVRFNWVSKLFNFGAIENKNFGQLILTYDKSPESVLKVDFLKNFGDRVISNVFDRFTPKELIVTLASSSIIILNSVDFSILRSTALDTNEFLVINGNSDDNFIVLTDRKKQRLVKMEKKGWGILVSTYGSLGSGTTNFNVPHQIKINGNSIFVNDLNNYRLKQHSLSDLSFIKMDGVLGQNDTSYHQATGLSVNENEATIAEEGNYILKKISISTFGFIAATPIDYNKIGDSSLEEDAKYLYLAYEKVSDETLLNVDIVLEKRIKTSMELVNKIKIRTINSISGSTYNIRGDIVLQGNYLYIAFTDDVRNPNKNYFIQKLLKSDFSLVKEYKTAAKIMSLVGYSNSYLSTTRVERKKIGMNGAYFQVRFYDDENDNSIKLFNQTLLLEPTLKSY